MSEENLGGISGFDDETPKGEDTSMEALLAGVEEGELIRDPAAAGDLSGPLRTAGDPGVSEAAIRVSERLGVVTSVIRSVNQLLVDATSRAELERGLCDLLVDEPYRFACVGGYTRAFDEFSIRAASHFDPDDVDGLDSFGVEDSPIQRAIETDDVTIVDEPGNVLRKPLEPVELDHHLESALVVPLTYRETVYGALLLYTGTRDLPEREGDVLGEIGDAIANGINSIERKKLLFGDTVVELELDISDCSDVFVALSADLDCRVSLEGFAPTSPEDVTCYLCVSGADPRDVIEFLAQAGTVETCRKVEDRGESAALIECGIEDHSVVRTLLNAGANVRAMEVESGDGRVGIEVAPEVDVRTVTGAVQEEFPETGLISKCETERSFESTRGFQSSLDDRFTDRQQAVIEATYNAGYFEWPRESTAEEIADSLGLAPPTLHEHLREAQRKLIEAYLDEAG